MNTSTLQNYTRQNSITSKRHSDEAAPYKTAERRTAQGHVPCVDHSSDHLVAVNFVLLSTTISTYQRITTTKLESLECITLQRLRDRTIAERPSILKPPWDESRIPWFRKRELALLIRTPNNGVVPPSTTDFFLAGCKHRITEPQLFAGL